MSWSSYVNQFGILGRMEAGRQSLQSSGEKGLSFRQLCEECGVDNDNASRSTLLMQLTRYCAIYEEEMPNGRVRYYLNEEMDEDFEREILPYDTKGEEDEREQDH
jgi:hypothetical protein